MYAGIHFSEDWPDPDNTHRLDLAALPMIHSMHRHGVRLDVPYINSLTTEINRQIADIEFEMGVHLGNYQDSYKGKLTPFSPGSPDHVSRLLFEHLRIQGDDPVPMTPKGVRYTTSDDVLEVFKSRHAIVPLLSDWRELTKVKTTYTEPLPLLVDGDSYLHTTFNPTVAATGRLSSSNPNCFDEETEVLTPDGWKRFAMLRQQANPDKVAQWDNGKISFVVPTGYIFGASPDLVEITNTHIDLKTTPNHRCLLRNRKTGGLRIFEASNYPEDWEQIQAGQFSGSGSKLLDDEIRFMLALQADGSWCGDGHAVVFTFKKKRKIDRMRKLLKNLGIVHSYNGKGASGRHSFYIPDCEATQKQFQLIGQKKLLSYSVLFSLNPHQLSVFTDEVMFWDGCWTRKNHYACKEKHNTEVVATSFTLSGRCTRVRKYVNQQGCVSWQADVTNRDYSLTTNRKKENSKRGSFIYCVSVPSSYLLVRRNGCTMVTGNCQNIPTRSKLNVHVGGGKYLPLGKAVRNAFIASPGCTFVSVDRSQDEMRWAAHGSQDPAMMEVFYLGQDIHWKNTCAIFGRDYDTVMAMDKKSAEFERIKREERAPTKNLGFGVLYGLTALGLQRNILKESEGTIRWSEEKCQKFIDQFFGIYPRLRAFMDLQYTRAKRYGMVWDAFGRPRLVPEAKSTHMRLVNEGTRKAGNHYEQSSSQGGVKLAMAETNVDMEKRNKSYRCTPALQIHDQILADVDKRHAEDFGVYARNVMEGSVNPFNVPSESSLEFGERWGEF